jgi:hypothetical protein
MGTMVFWECIRQAWTEAAKFIRRKPLAIILTFAILLACHAIVQTVGQQHGAVLPASRAVHLIWLTSIVQMAAVIALPVDVMRYVMLGEQDAGRRRAFGSGFLRYLLLTLIFVIGAIVIGALLIGVGYFLTHFFKGYFGTTRLQLIAWGVIAACVVSYLGVRFSLLFCHVAIGRAMRWRATWKDTRGHVWRIVLSHLLASVPVQLCLVGTIALTHASIRATGRLPFPYFDAIFRTLFTSVGLVVGATCACWLYRRFAERLLENP